MTPMMPLDVPTGNSELDILAKKVGLPTTDQLEFLTMQSAINREILEIIKQHNLEIGLLKSEVQKANATAELAINQGKELTTILADTLQSIGKAFR